MAKGKKDKNQLSEKKSFRKQLFKTVYDRLDTTFVEYKEIVGEKRLNRFLKKTSKAFAKQAGKRHNRLAKKATQEVVVENVEGNQ